MLDTRPVPAARAVAVRAALVIAGSLLMALSAKIIVPLQPVPITGQTLALPLVVALLGRTGAVLAMLAYLAEGAAGLPVFASGALLAATGGYLVSYPFAAALIGTLYATRLGASYAGRFAATFAGGALILAIGCVWLGVALHLSAPQALALGALPFLTGDVIKCALAAALAPSWPAIAARLGLR